MSLTMEDRTPLSISQLNIMVKDLLENNLPPLWVEGEISNFARPASGHMYFSLKDESCQVRSVMFRNRNMLLDFKPANGTHVLAKVRIGFYEARGEFQLIIDRMEEVGDGQLQQQFERLKRKLATEGLFDEDNKLDIPELPQKIGVITSPTGAAIRDVLSVLKRRFPAIPVVIYPVPVQGDDAAPKIAKMIKTATKHNQCDVLLLVRGGGSLEDLWAFNEEIVARAIYDCPLPIISGIGHETDISIADFVADIRAATPSAAAELVVPDQYSYQQSFDYYFTQLSQIINRDLTEKTRTLGWLSQRLNQQHPRQKLAQFTDRRKDLLHQLHILWKHRHEKHQTRLQFLLNRLLQQSPSRIVAYQQRQVQTLLKHLHQQQQQIIQKKQQHLALYSRSLHTLSPLQTLSRGFAIASPEGQNINLTDASQVQTDDIIHLRLYQGSLKTRVIERHLATPPDKEN